MSWVQTHSGKAVDLFDTSPDSIDFKDIAHALSLLCRFTGHTEEHYSVAQHCVLVSSLLPESMQLYGLLHDAHEAFIGDINTVVKRALGAGREVLRRMADDLDSAIHAAAGLGEPSEEIKAAVKFADVTMLMTERRDLMSAPPHDWGDFENVHPVHFEVRPWRAEKAHDIWLSEVERHRARLHCAPILDTYRHVLGLLD